MAVLTLTHYKDSMSAWARTMKIFTWLWIAGIMLQSVVSFNYCRLKCPAFDPKYGTVHLPGPTKQHFYKCRFGVGILFKCRRGTHFNPRTQVCDWPWRARAVRCKGSPDHEPEGSGDDGGYIRI